MAAPSPTTNFLSGPLTRPWAAGPLAVTHGERKSAGKGLRRGFFDRRPAASKPSTPPLIRTAAQKPAPSRSSLKQVSPTTSGAEAGLVAGDQPVAAPPVFQQTAFTGVHRRTVTFLAVRIPSCITGLQHAHWLCSASGRHRIRVCTRSHSKCGTQTISTRCTELIPAECSKAPAAGVIGERHVAAVPVPPAADIPEAQSDEFPAKPVSKFRQRRLQT